MKVDFLKPKLPKFMHIKNYFAQMYKHHTFSNNGAIVQAFEKRMREMFEYDGEVITCANGTLALILPLKAMGFKKALVPAFTFPATLQALNWAGIKYEYVDIHPTKWTMDIHDLERKIHDTGADVILPVHSFGSPCDVQSIARLSAINNIKVVYDAAPAISSFVNIENKNIHIANFGDVSCFSLHATKVLPAIEGGAIFVKDRDLGKEIRSMCNFGFQGDRVPNHAFGMNAKMSEPHAAFGMESLSSLGSNQKNRFILVDKYKHRLSDYVDFQEIEKDSISSHQVFSLILRKEDAHLKDKIISEMLEVYSVQCRDYYNPPLHKVKAFRKRCSLPVTEDVCSRIITLPLHLWMKDEDLSHVIQSFISTIEGLRG